MTKPGALKCPSCGSFFRKQDLDSARGLLSCSYCKALMALAPAPGAATDEAQPRAEAPRPPGVSLRETRDGIELRRSWFQPMFGFLALFCLIWDGFLVLLLGGAVQADAFGPVAFFTLGHSAVGLGLTYWTLAGLLNTTTITVERRTLRIRHSPIPWRSLGSLEAASVMQLYVRPRRRVGHHGESWTYEVRIVLRDKRSLLLVANLPDPESALYIEQRIEAALGLPDLRIAGELERD